MRRAVIDIGTNTAHLLIAQLDDSNSIIDEILFKLRVYTYLGSYGLESIHPDPLKKLYHGLKLFDQHIKLHECEQTKVFATEAMRTASNGPLIIEKIHSIYGWNPVIIDGFTEASYIVKGAKQAVDMSHGHYLVMDIGGGSVEFISVCDGKTVNLISTPLGISRLFQKYHQVDPILPEMAELLSHDVKKELDEMNIDNESAITLVGTAGSFEIFMDIDDLIDITITSKHIEVDDVLLLCQKMQMVDIQERQESDLIPDNRAKYIVVALLLIKAVIEKFEISEMIVSKYALKEGAIVD